jgi:DNA sulfur modification protein DndD
MNLISLKLNNFGIFSGEHQIDFQVNDQLNNIVLIGGMNGRGKTTILEAILLCLYGKRSISFIESNMSYTAYLKKYINKFNESGVTSIELCFSLRCNEEDITFKVKRYWEKNKGNVSDKIIVFNNHIVDDHLAQNWDTYIEEVFPAGIAGLFFFDGEKITRLANEETNEEMKKSINSLLGIDVIDKSILDLKRIISKKNNEVTYIRDSEDIKVYTDELNSQRQELDLHKSDHAKHFTEFIKQKNKLEETEFTYIKKGGKLSFDRGALIKERDEYSKQLHEEKQKLIEIAAGPFPLLLVKSLIDKVYNSAKSDENIKAAKYASSFLSKLKSSFIKKLNDVDISPSNKMELVSVFDNEVKKLKNLENMRQIHDLNPITLQMIESALVDVTNSLIKGASDTLNSHRNLEIALQNIERHLLVEVDENETNKLLNEIKSISVKIAQEEQIINSINEKIKHLEISVKGLEAKLRRTLQKLVEDRFKNEDSARIIKYSDMSIAVLEKYRQTMILKKVNNLSLTVTDCFNYITHKESLLSRIEIDPLSLNLTLLDSNNSIILKSQLSAGEKQMLAISLLWGLAKESKQNLPVIIDSPLGRLDSSHRYNFINKYLVNASKQVIVLSTDQEVIGNYLETIEDRIAHKYTLVYDENRKATDVVKGYFQGAII